MFSPIDFETTYVAAEHRIYAWTANNSNFVHRAIAAAALCLYVDWIQEFIRLNQTDVSGGLFYLLPYISRGIYVVIAASTALAFFSKAQSRIVLPVFCVALSLYSNYVLFSNHHLGPMFWLTCLFTPVLLALAATYHFGHTKFPGRRIFFAYTFVHFAWVIIILHTLLSDGRDSTVSFLFGFKSILFWFWIVSRTRNGTLTFREITNPMNALRAWPWPPPTEDKTSTEHIWWNGIANILLGYTLFAACAWLTVHDRVGLQKVGFNYIIHILIDVATLNLIPGVARLFGFNLIDATYFSFLAKSPAELWRRGSVYNYKFNIEFIFWPVIRFVRNYWVALFLAFSMFYLNSLTFESIAPIVSSSASNGDFHSRLEAARAVGFFLYFLLICIPSRIWSFPMFPMAAAQRQWLSVCATHLSNLFVLYVAYALATHVLMP
ncbi:hypothetical protein BH10BDE1_BH10BDE1_30760 [soil metagenome]